MKLKVPELLAHVELSKVDLVRILPNLRNWKTFINCYSNLSKQELEKYIIVELNYKCRESYVKRLMSSYRRKFLRARQMQDLRYRKPDRRTTKIFASIDRENTAA